MSNLAYIIGEDSMTVFVQGNTHTVSKSNPEWANILNALKFQDEQSLLEFLNPTKKIRDMMKGNIEIRGGVLFYKEKSISNSFIDRIIKMGEQGFDIDPLLVFLERLMKNPSSTAIRELYLFLESCSLPITTDGHFLAYKRVRDDFKDFYSGTFDNSIGQVVEMERNQVDDTRENTCSTGLHFCSIGYLKEFHPGQGKVVILKIDPADVVSIPADYQNTKGRTCKYIVVGEHAEPERDAFGTIVNDDYDEWEDSDDVFGTPDIEIDDEDEELEDKQGVKTYHACGIECSHEIGGKAFWDSVQQGVKKEFLEYLERSNTRYEFNEAGDIILSTDMYLGNVELEIPEGTIFKGYLDLRNTKMFNIADNLTIERFLSLERTGVYRIPKNLKVGEHLNIRGTEIRYLPDDLEVTGLIICDKDQLIGVREKFKHQIREY